jgi:hypothetical protein
MYEINEYGKYKIYKENWYIHNEKSEKVGSYYMFIDNNRTLIIDKLNFDQDMEESKKEKRDHAKLFLEQIINFCEDHRVIVAVSPDRIRDRKLRKKVKDFYKEHGFVSNHGDKLMPIITETMYRPL